MDRVIENALLGKFMLDKQLLLAARRLGSSQITPDDFEEPQNRLVFEAIVRLHDRGAPVDEVTVIAELKKMGQLEEAGGIDYLTLLVDSIPNQVWPACLKMTKAELIKAIVASG